MSLLWGILSLFIVALALISDSPVLIYIASAQNSTDIYFYDVPTGLNINFSHTIFPEWRGTWSEENRIFAFTASYSDSESDGLFISQALAPPQRIESLRYNFIFGTTLAPDGTKLAYVSSETVNYSEIYLLNLGDESIHNLSQSPNFSESSPQWFADNRHLLFLREGNLYKMDSQTSRSELLVNRPFPIESAQLSPDNRWIAFHEIQSDWRYLVLVGSDGQNPQRLPLEQILSSDAITWSPDSQKIAFVLSDGALGIYRLESQAFSLFRGDGRRISPSWSPDGRYIAFLENRQIFLLDWQSGSIENIKENRQIRPHFLWLP